MPLQAAESLEGERVVGASGEELGAIEEIMIDVQRGIVAYAIVSRDGIAGMEERLFPIPWGALELDAQRHCFVLDTDGERFATAPGFDKDHWPSMADERWAAEVHRFYGMRPYWDARSGGGVAGNRTLRA
jgi:sporulation protein YlmC with PRC-barrel domain